VETKSHHLCVSQIHSFKTQGHSPSATGGCAFQKQAKGCYILLGRTVLASMSMTPPSPSLGLPAFSHVSARGRYYESSAGPAPAQARSNVEAWLLVSSSFSRLCGIYVPLEVPVAGVAIALL